MRSREMKAMKRTIGTGALALALTAAAGGARAQEEAHAGHGHEEPLLWTFMVERLEHRWQDGENAVDWDAQGFVGGDDEKVWLKAEGGMEAGGAVEEAEVQLLYSRMVSDFWDFQAGIRHDFRPRPQTTHAVAGFQGLAPFFLEVDAQAFLSEEGDVTAALEVETDLLITQKLVLQPRAELHLALQDVEPLGIGAGPGEVALGVRLRYEVVREFAPYVGVQWDRKLGDTARFARAEGEDADAVTLLAGVRFWF